MSRIGKNADRRGGYLMAFTLFVAGTLALTAFIAWATYRSAQVLRQMQVDFNLLLLPAENLLRVGMVVACLILGWASGLPREQFGWTSHAPLTDLAIGLAVGVLAQTILNALTDWAISRFGPDIYSPVVMLSILPRSQEEWAPVLLALFPAVLVEELLFRSLLLGGLAVAWPVPVLIIGTALLFGWMHSPQGRLGVVMTAAVSMLLAALFLWRGSLLPPLAAHYVVNLLQLVIAHRRRDELERLRH
jgi:membrane protease YdiL (CAAX protease family)